MREDFDTIVVPFLDKHSEVFTEVIKSKFFSFEDFKAMLSLVSSRAMDVDNYHASALVPFADLYVSPPLSLPLPFKLYGGRRLIGVLTTDSY